MFHFSFQSFFQSDFWQKPNPVSYVSEMQTHYAFILRVEAQKEAAGEGAESRCSQD